MKAKIRWFKTLEPEDKQKFKVQLEGSTHVLDRLKEILEQMYEESLKETEKEAAYQMDSWALFQAHHVGKRQTIRELIDLVTLTED